MRLVALAMLAALLFVACGRETAPKGPSSTAPAAGPATFTVPNGQSSLGAARRDAARRAGVDPANVEMHDVQMAGMSGCAGVRPAAGQACPALLGAGMVAFFRAGGDDLRYHVLGGQVVGPVGPGDIYDIGGDIGGLRFDLMAKLAEYALDDAVVRQGATTGSLAVTSVVPDGTGARIAVEGAKAPTAYRLDAAAGVSVLASVTAAPPALAALELAMREDLARRLGKPLAEVSILDYREVTWPDGCLGVQKPGGVCTQALVPGFLAVLGDGSGREYEYHGAGTAFVAASLEAGAVLMAPLP